MLAIGNNELGDLVLKGDVVTNGALTGILEHGKDGETGIESDMLGFITVENRSYLVSIKGQLIDGWKVLDK